MNRASASSFALSLFLSPSLSMSMLTNCTYPTSPWCEGHRTHSYIYTTMTVITLQSSCFFFLLSLSILFFYRISSNNLTDTDK
jgi:hypothetical protein